MSRASLGLFLIPHYHTSDKQLPQDMEVTNQNPDFIKDWQASKRYLELSCGLHLLQHSQGSI